MKVTTAFAIVRTAPVRKTIRVTDSRLPLYWFEKVALENCPRNHEVIKVTITESKGGQS